MKINIGVMFGGASVEHEISIITAMQAIKALDKSRYQVFPIYITKNFEFYYSDSFQDVSLFSDLNNIVKKGNKITLFSEQGKTFFKTLTSGLFKKEILQRIDIFFPIFHGTNGEDGTIQGLLEALGATYTGCDILASAVGQDKVIMKQVLAYNKISLIPWTWFYYHEFFENKSQYLKEVKKLGYPIIVKPASLGSSIGISKCQDELELVQAIEEAKNYDNKIVVEKLVLDFIELNASVLGDSFQQRVSVVEEVLAEDEILTYEDKYLNNHKSKGMAATSRIIPANIDQKLTQRVQDLAIDTFKALGSSGVSRIDLIYDRLSKEVFVNEINSLPGSLAFYLWTASGVSFEELLDSIIKLAIERTKRKEKLTFTYQTNVLEGFVAGGLKGMKK